MNRIWEANLYGRYVVMYSFCTEIIAALVCDTIRDALRNEEAADELILHSDQGWQYTSKITQEITL